MSGGGIFGDDVKEVMELVKSLEDRIATLEQESDSLRDQLKTLHEVLVNKGILSE